MTESVRDVTLAKALRAYLHVEVDYIIETLAHAWFSTSPQDSSPTTAHMVLAALENYLREERVKIFEEKLGDLATATPSSTALMDPEPAEFGRLIKVANFYKLGNVFVMLYLHAFLLEVRRVQTPLEDFRKIVEDLDPQ